MTRSAVYHQVDSPDRAHHPTFLVEKIGCSIRDSVSTIVVGTPKLYVAVV